MDLKNDNVKNAIDITKKKIHFSMLNTWVI